MRALTIGYQLDIVLIYLLMSQGWRVVRINHQGIMYVILGYTVTHMMHAVLIHAIAGDQQLW